MKQAVIFYTDDYFSMITKSSKTKSESLSFSFSIPNQELPFSEAKKVKVAVVGTFAAFNEIDIFAAIPSPITKA
jgi:hypothetical protein